MKKGKKRLQKKPRIDVIEFMKASAFYESTFYKYITSEPKKN